MEEFTKMKQECNIINEKINKLRDDIEEYKLDINVFSKYGDELDKKYALEIQEQEKNKLLDSVINNQNEENKDDNGNENNQNENHDTLAKTNKNPKLELLSAIANMKKQREEKLKIIKENKIKKDMKSHHQFKKK